jgi:hypothetical protein
LFTAADREPINPAQGDELKWTTGATGLSNGAAGPQDKASSSAFFSIPRHECDWIIASLSRQISVLKSLFVWNCVGRESVLFTIVPLNRLLGLGFFFMKGTLMERESFNRSRSANTAS